MDFPNLNEFLGLSWKGNWQAASSYFVDNVVSFNGDIYICIANNNGVLPTDASAWITFNLSNAVALQSGGLKYKGTWDGVENTYVPGDVVTYSDEGYVCTEKVVKQFAYEDDFQRPNQAGWGPIWLRDNSWNGVNFLTTSDAAWLANFAVQDDVGTVTLTNDVMVDNNHFPTTYLPNMPTDKYDLILTWSIDIQPPDPPSQIPYAQMYGRLNSNADQDGSAPFWMIGVHGSTSSIILLTSYDEFHISAIAIDPLSNETIYKTRIRADNPFFAMKIWLASDPEPTDWTNSFTLDNPVTIVNLYPVEQPGPVNHTIITFSTNSVPSEVFRIYDFRTETLVTTPDVDTDHWGKL